MNSIPEFDVTEIELGSLAEILESNPKAVYYSAEPVHYVSGVKNDAIGSMRLKASDIRRLINEGTRDKFWRDGKKIDAPLEVICLSQNSTNMFETFQREVRVKESLARQAKRTRQQAIAELRGVDNDMRALLQKFNVTEDTVSRDLEDNQRKLSKILKEYNGKIGRYMDPLKRDPLVHAFAEHSPEDLKHSLDVLNIAAAIYLLGNHTIGTPPEEVDEGMKHLTLASFLHDTADSYIRRSRLNQSQLKAISPAKDLIIPRRMFLSKEGNYINEMTPEALEAIEHHHTPRSGRVVIYPGKESGVDGERVAFITNDSFRVVGERGKYSAVQQKLMEGVSRFYGQLNGGELDRICAVENDLHQPILLAELWVSSVSSLQAVSVLDKVTKRSGFLARPEYVEALKEIADKNYSLG